MSARHDQRDVSGAVAIELAFALPIVLLCVLGLIDFGRALWSQSTLNYAVQAAARCAAVNPTLCGTSAQIQSFAVGAAAGLTVKASNFSVTTAACGINVGASLPFEFSVPDLFQYTLVLSANACYPT